MRPAQAIFRIAVIIAAAAFLLYLLHGLIETKAVPTLGQYVASSTQAADMEASSSEPEGSAIPMNAPISYLFMPIHAPQGTIQAMIASTTDVQELGLGQRASLPAGQGMLFVFPDAGTYGFWMKAMQFPLDMVWIDSSHRVAGVTANISPDTFPEVFLPPSEISYVLELNAGASERFGIATGTQLSF